jgi:hypothetical protein
MAGSILIALAIAVAFASQLWLVEHIRRRWASIPARIPYGTLPGRNFAWAPRELVWLTPATFLTMLAVITVVIATAPPFVRSEPLVAIPFIIIALCTPLLRAAIDDKIDAARNHK